MLPSYLTIISYLIAVMIITSIVYILPEKLRVVGEVVFVLSVILYLFVKYPMGDAMVLFALTSTAYANLSTLLDPSKRDVRRKLSQGLREQVYETVQCTKTIKRIWIDILIVGLASSLALVFLIWAPDTYIIIKFIIMLSLITVTVQLVGRLGNYFTTTIYWLPETERMIIISLFESREFPVQDLEKVTLESNPDILRLHPLFSFMAQRQDYTTSLEQVLRLDFPGEHIYFSPAETRDWYDLLAKYVPAETDDQLKEIIPLWHPKNIKRLIWKGYFAITVKGISAYTGLLLILIFFKVPPFGMIIIILLWWVFNLYVSDRVLIAGTDATVVEEGPLFEIVKQLSERANIKQPNIYLIDSPIYNGLATGMNIGQGTIMVTTATLRLPTDAIESIIAHEIIHVKKRDILVNQLARMGFFVVLGSIVYLFFDQIALLTEYPLLLTAIIYVLMMLFPIYLSLVSQFCEMRADYLASELLEQEQMAEGLLALGRAQEDATKKTLKYSQQNIKEQKRNRGIVERGPWFVRIIEFQLMPHPPLYFRVYSLRQRQTWRKTLATWLIARTTESLPDLFGRKSKYG